MQEYQINDYITHVDDKVWDLPFLKTEFLPVNMRLFHSSQEYRSIITSCCIYLKWLAGTTMKGYKKPHGMSGANAAIPFNIIAVVRNRGKDNEWVQVFINPKVVNSEGHPVKTMSNCGSIRLKEPIEVYRYPRVLIQFYNIEGGFECRWFDREQGAFTIQHEIDHNNGILITDYHKKEKDDR